MTAELNTLIITAASIGFFHTLLGPDHYLPFVMMSWARKWSRTKTVWITILCGIGHIASSIVLGLIGVSVGLAVTKLEVVESFRGNVAAWMLVAFGMAYFVWGIRRAIRNRPHVHSHIHANKTEHAHTHSHLQEHSHVHDTKKLASVTPWALFTIFVFGPCEPLIPVLMYPAAKNSLLGLCVVIGVFGIATLATMVGLVLLSIAGTNFIQLTRIQRFSHAIAGATICICGFSIALLGL